MDEARRALGIALNMLSRRDHSEAEVRRRLSAKGFSLDTGDEVIARLREAGYLNDRRFSRAYAESAIRNGRGYGFRLRLDLSRRGVDEEIIADAMDEVGAEYDEIATLTGLMARKFAGFDPREADDRLKRRVVGYFQRRGFSLAAIVRVMRDTEG
jgi:regulatory protein